MESEAIVWIKVSDLVIGDIVVSANEVMEVDSFIVDAVEHFNDYSVVNACHYPHKVNVPSIERFGGRMVWNQVQVVSRGVRK